MDKQLTQAKIGSNGNLLDSKTKLDQDYVFVPDLDPNVDPDTQKLFEAILALGILYSKQTETSPVKLYGLGKPVFISKEHACKILNIDEQGKDLPKKNMTGKSSVTSQKNIYFKKCPNYMDGPQLFLTEQAVYQMSLLLGGGIITPTRFLVFEFPEKEKIMVQASLSVEGEHLGDILSLPGLMKGLERSMGQEKFKQELPFLLKQNYYTEWLLQQHIKAEADIPFERKLDLLTDAIYQLPSDERPKEFVNVGVKTKLKDAIKDHVNDTEILPVVALMMKYRQQVKNLHFGDLLRIPNAFKAGSSIISQF